MNLLRLPLLALALALGSLTFGVGCSSMELPEQQARIDAEQPGNYWVGRRFYVPGTRLWGYVRKPGTGWRNSRLVLFDEQFQHAPDRLPEDPGEGIAHGFDHNYEYHLLGEFRDTPAYDPNSDLVAPVFTLRGYKLVDRMPGSLFTTNDVYKQTTFPRWQ